ncbi:hypothetical protein MHYP_G00002150 [Metynnis hypsauchen]
MASAGLDYYTRGQQGQQLQDYTKAWEEYYKKQGQAAPQTDAIQTTAQPGPSIIASRRLTMARVALGPWEQHRRPSRYAPTDITPLYLPHVVMVFEPF